MLFDGWTDLGRTLLSGVLSYVAIVVLLRATGKRTLAKWNAFDFIVTIALGSILATMILSKDVAILDGVVALAVLIGLQFVVTWLSVRAGWLRRLVKSDPALLLYRGRLQEETLRRERVTVSEVHAALRAHGIGAEDGVAAVVLETDGTFSVIEDLDGPAKTLEDVRGFDEARGRA